MKNKQYQIYIGHKDKDTFNYFDDFHNLVRTMENYFTKNKIAFSKELLTGGYVTTKGNYIFEDSYVYCFIGKYHKRKILNFLKQTKEIFNQESILITISNVESEYISHGC